ncbi:MAG: hypothetical protein ACXIUZ_01245 [Lysobacteraceae bacterium]
MNTDAFWLAIPIAAISILLLAGAARGFSRVVSTIHPMGHWLLSWPPTRRGLLLAGIGGLLLAAALVLPLGRPFGPLVALLAVGLVVAGAVHDRRRWIRNGRADPFAAEAARRRRKAFGQDKTHHPTRARKKKRH